MIKHRSRFGFSLIELSVVIIVIGILVVGITSGSRIIAQSRIRSAASLTNSSPVSSTPNLLVWVEATNDQNFGSNVEDGNSISIWNDINPQSSNIKNNFTQATSENMPIYKRSAINGLPGVYFNGSKLLNTENIANSTFSPNNQNTVFLVAIPTSGTVIFQYKQSNTDTFAVEMIGSNIWMYFPNNSTGAVGTSSGVSSTKPIVITADKNSTTGSLYIDGSLINSRSNSLTFSTTFSIPIRIGAASGGAFSMNGYIGEVIVFNRSLQNQERVAIEEYLEQKWQIK